MNHLNPHNKGFLQIIIIIIIALIVLGYFSINIADVIASPVVQDNLSYAWNLVKNIWKNYLQRPATWIWNNIVNTLWNLFLQGLERLRNRETVDKIPKTTVLTHAYQLVRVNSLII